MWIVLCSYLQSKPIQSLFFEEVLMASDEFVLVKKALYIEQDYQRPLPSCFELIPLVHTSLSAIDFNTCHISAYWHPDFLIFEENHQLIMLRFLSEIITALFCTPTRKWPNHYDIRSVTCDIGNFGVRSPGSCVCNILGFW